MAEKTALCPDGVERPYTVDNDGMATVELRGNQIRGTVTVVKGVTMFRQSANHYAAHRMWYPPVTQP
jgi:hypothetical protein